MYILFSSVASMAVNANATPRTLTFSNCTPMMSPRPKRRLTISRLWMRSFPSQNLWAATTPSSLQSAIAYTFVTIKSRAAPGGVKTRETRSQLCIRTPVSALTHFLPKTAKSMCSSATLFVRTPPTKGAVDHQDIGASTTRDCKPLLLLIRK